MWRRIDVATLRDNLQELLDNLNDARRSDQSTAGFRTTEIQVAVTIGGKGEVGILGTGVEVTGEASLTFVLTRQVVLKGAKKLGSGP